MWARCEAGDYSLFPLAGRGRGSHPYLDDGNAGDGAVAETLEVDLEFVGVEADGDVELEAGGDGGVG
jgi:hypothetical protein